MNHEDTNRLVNDLKELVQAMDGGVILRDDLPNHTKELICGMIECAYALIEKKNQKELN